MRWFPTSWFGLLNFLLLQWFGVRLARVVQLVGRRRVHRGWRLLRWVWPLTGWWSPYRWIWRIRG